MPPAPSPPLSPERVAELSLVRVPFGAAALATGAVGTLILGLASDRPSILTASIVTIVLMVGLIAVCHRGRLPAAWAPATLAAQFILTVADLAILRLATDDPATVNILALVIAAYGVLQLDWRWVAAVYAAAVIPWFALGLATPDSLDMLTLLAGVALGGMVMRSNASFVEGTEALRRLAESRAAELATALAAAEREIAERERAETARIEAEAEREQLRDQFVAAQKLEAVGTLAGGIAHDLNNVLTGISALAELSREETTGQLRDDLEQIVASCHRGAALTRNLLAYSRKGPSRRGPVASSTIVATVRSLLERTLPKRIQLATTVDTDATIVGDADQLVQAVINLCLNSVDAIRGEGRISLTAGVCHLDDRGAEPTRTVAGSYAAIAVTDTGAGIDAATQARMFEPFFTSKPIGKGTGLGLTMVHATITQHRGAIDVESTVGVGTTITLLVPATPGATTAVRASVTAAPAARHRILVVDDEEVVRTTTRRVLERAGHEVVIADGGAAALAAYRERAPFAVVVLDMAMPGMSGAECFRALRTDDPGARVLLVSGYADQGDLRRCLDGGALGYVAKPYDVTRLVAAVEAAAAGLAVPRADDEA